MISSEKEDLSCNKSNCYFPKKSHCGYYDKGLQQHFYDKKTKLAFLNKNGIVEKSPASREHIKRVTDFVAWAKDEKRKNPNFESTQAYKRERYPG